MNLDEILDLATDAVEPPGLAPGALAEARRRRARSRGVVSLVAVAAAVVLLVVSVRVVTGDPRGTERPVAPASSAPTAGPGRFAPPVRSDVVQPLWDPRGVEGLPVLALGVPRVLPGASTSSGLVADPVALLDDGRQVLLVGADGSAVPLGLPQDVGRRRSVALSPDGTRVAVLGKGLLWRELAGGDWQRTDTHPGIDADADLSWLPDGSGVLVHGYPSTFRVDLPSGRVVELDHLEDRLSVGVEPDGTILSTTEVRELVEWRNGREIRRNALGRWGGMGHPVAGGDAVAVTRAVITSGRETAVDRDGLAVLDRGTLETRAYLPVTDDHDYYVHADELRPLSWLDGDTLLLTVHPKDAAKEYLVAWDIRSGVLSRVACWPASYDAAFAADLLRRR